ncbi:hypothetical protein DPMN_084090 [Dreissena polymorpha]|uniref:Uncharacterized protein n=1 Tax=Dreissena polymorpha TaxID=45954 RepID=A0A9D3YDP5_DREPO|nr:hypothetical protein DPMN_084090 [Dreissena polymorpha]
MFWKCYIEATWLRLELFIGNQKIAFQKGSMETTKFHFDKFHGSYKIDMGNVPWKQTCFVLE